MIATTCRGQLEKGRQIGVPQDPKNKSISITKEHQQLKYKQKLYVVEE